MVKLSVILVNFSVKTVIKCSISLKIRIIFIIKVVVNCFNHEVVIDYMTLGHYSGPFLIRRSLAKLDACQKFIEYQ